MEQTLPVDGTQGIHDRHQELQRDLAADPAPRLLFQVVAEGDPVHVIHDAIAGAMGTEKVLDRGDARMLVKMGQGARLLEKSIQPIGELSARGPGIDGDAEPVRPPAGAIAGEIFLDRQPQLEIVIPGEVSDPKSPLAQDPADAIAAIEDPAQGESRRGVVPRPLPATTGAGGPGGSAKTIRARYRVRGSPPVVGRASWSVGTIGHGPEIGILD